MTRAQLLAHADAMELAYWKAKEQIDGPYGKRQEELRMARMVAAVTGQTDIYECLPSWYRNQPDVIEAQQQPQQTEEEMKQVWNGITKTWEA